MNKGFGLGAGKVWAMVLAGLVLSSGFGCKAKPKKIEEGSTVKFHYTLTVDGAPVDSSVGKEPMSFVQGSPQIIPGLQEQMMGMMVGEKKSVDVAPEKAYGMPNPNAVQKVARTIFKDIKDLKVGSMVKGQSGNQPIQARVIEIGKKEVTLDMNHPLAGKALHFDVEVVDIQPKVK